MRAHSACLGGRLLLTPVHGAVLPRLTGWSWLPQGLPLCPQEGQAPVHLQRSLHTPMHSPCMLGAPVCSSSSSSSMLHW